MASLHTRWRFQFLILFVCGMILSSFPAHVGAQTPPPPVPPGNRDLPEHSAQVYVPGETGEQLQPAPAADEQPPDPAATDTSDLTATDTISDAYQIGQPLSARAMQAPIYAASPAATNDVRVDVSVPGTTHAGETIDYTYTYTNTTATARDITLQVSWTNFSTSANGNWQFCLSSGTEANCKPIMKAGPTVSGPTSCASGKLCYQVNGLPGNSTGQFNVRLGIKKDVFPRTNEEIHRPASSVELFVGTEQTVTSQDTANTLIVGPVLALTKVPADPTKKIYPTTTDNPNERGEFIITLGNATGDKDQPGGQPRADAEAARNIVLVDTFPDGGEYVSNQTPSGIPSPNVDTNARTITWNIPGPLLPGQTLPEFHVTFRKADVNRDCNRLTNAVYNVTSDEYPINSGTTRYTVAGKAVGIDVVVPLKIAGISYTPRPVYFGGAADIAITVQNYYDQPLSSIQLYYNIQTNATYLAGTADPAPSTTPPTNTPGGQIMWTFNMPAGSKTAPTEKVFRLTVQGGYTSTASAGDAQLVLNNPGVATACIKTLTGRANFEPRLLVKKYTEEDASTKIGSTYSVENGQEFNYIISVENRGTTTAQDVDVQDRLPGETGANFRYKVGSSTINGVAHNPDSFVDGAGGNIFWNNLVVPAGETLIIRYTLLVGGEDYVTYCNLVNAQSNNSPDENILFSGNKVCVKINPDIEVTKTINGTTETVQVNPGDEVTFRLTITNKESRTYRVGLYDKLNQFTYVSMVSGYDLNPTLLNGALKWQLIDLQPGQMREVVFKARVPSDCVTKDYVNEALFHNDQGNIIQPAPAVLVRARVNCGKVEFRKDVSSNIVSLQDRLVYSLKVKNTDGKSIANVQVEDVLPRGFDFVGMESGSIVTTLPTTATLADGRLKLLWTIPNINANTEVIVKYVARSGSVVGTADKENANIVRTTPGTCPGACVSYNDDVYTFKAVQVLPLITSEPKISPDQCATPGNKRTYQVTIVNTNNHAYTNATVAVTLPLGLQFVRPLNTTPAPSLLVKNEDGGVTVLWNNLTIPAKPNNAVASQVLLEAELQVGHVWGNVQTLVQSTSPDGAIPRKDGAIDPVVQVCPTKPSIAKEINWPTAEAGDEVLYQITVANTNAQAIAGVTVDDTLPAGLTFVRMVQGSAPSQSGNRLTWTVDVPPATNSSTPGVAILKFRARIDSNAKKGTEYINMATASAGATSFDTTYNAARVTVVVLEKTYLPLIGISR